MALLAVVAVVNMVVLAVAGVVDPAAASRADIVIWTTVAVAGVIGIASFYKTAALRSGGSQIAVELGGRHVPQTADPLQRRLLNIVEEMAIASGIPMPEVYVLENEAGINAFAAGWGPADAAVAVTRGALTSLNRSELQGVIGHGSVTS